MAIELKIRLLTIFLIFICAAVGLTCGTAPERKQDPDLASLNIHFPSLNLYHAFLYASSMAMVIGLSQQVRILHRNWSSANDEEFRFAYHFAVTWRIAMVILFCSCLFARVLLSRNILQFPNDDVLLYESFPDTMTLICVIVVLINNVERWQRKDSYRKQPAWLTGLVFAIALILLLILLPDTGMIAYLVHVATQGIERAQPARFQRIGVFPDHEREAFRLFWLSVASVVAVAIAAAGLVIANTVSMRRRFAILCVATSLIALVASAVFVVWYYAIEFHRASPDMASAGFAGNWIQRLSGMVVTMILITCAAFRFAKKGGTPSAVSSLTADASHILALHQYFIFYLLLVAVPVVFVFESVHADFSGGLRLGWQRDVLSEIGEYLRDPETYLRLAVGVLGAQLCWLQWKRGFDIPLWNLHPIERRKFIGNWIALALLIAVGLPTMAIYSFVYWLGPWYLYGGAITLPR